MLRSALMRFWTLAGNPLTISWSSWRRTADDMYAGEFSRYWAFCSVLSWFSCTSKAVESAWALSVILDAMRSSWYSQLNWCPVRKIIREIIHEYFHCVKKKQRQYCVDCKNAYTHIQTSDGLYCTFHWCIFFGIRFFFSWTVVVTILDNLGTFNLALTSVCLCQVKFPRYLAVTMALRSLFLLQMKLKTRHQDFEIRFQCLRMNWTGRFEVFPILMNIGNSDLVFRRKKSKWK